MSIFDEFEVEVDSNEKGLYKVNTERKYKIQEKNFRKRILGHLDKIILAAGIILIAGISFQAGFLKGQKNQGSSIEVNQAVCAPCSKAEENNKTDDSIAGQAQTISTKEENLPAAEDQKCVFVASKNSNKYHLPTCQYAQKIKAENKICFSSAEEAQSRGYQPAKCCIK